MNYIDQNFKWLTHTIKSTSKEECINHIKEKWKGLQEDTRHSIEKFLNDFKYWGAIDTENNIYEQIENKADSLYDHIDDYIWLYDYLEDYRSKKLLFAILYNWYDYNFQFLQECIENTYSHYFDLDLIHCKDEVFVDIGAYNGDTVLDFIHSYGIESYKKIYCYEATKLSYENLKKNTGMYPNIEYINKAISNQEETLYIQNSIIDQSANFISKDTGEEVQTTTIDKDIDERITMIKMDIEGYEKKALEGCKSHILNSHPKLLISVYHNHEDLYKIPKMINEISSQYHFYLRFYGSSLFPTEIVLFAIAK